MTGLGPSLTVLVSLATLAAVSMAVYALAGARRDPDAERRGSRFLLGAGDFLMHWLMWAVSPLERLSLRAGISSDVYNLAGLGFGIASGAALASGHLEVGGWAIALGGVCDVLDGRLARARHVASAYGAFIDSTLDRFVEVFVFLGFVVYLRRFAFGPLAAAAAVTGSLLVSYARARGESLGVECREGLMQRAERLFLVVTACLFDGPLCATRGWPPGSLVLWTLALIAAGTFVTAIQRTVWIARRLLSPGGNATHDPDGSGLPPLR